jgi:ABC-type polysaccharide/polyol phosphate export permease
MLGRSPSWDLVVISAVAVCVSLAAGIAYFQRVERRFVDVV